MPIERPELSNLPQEVVAYILELEAELQKYRSKRPGTLEPDEEAADLPFEPNEPPTTINILTATPTGMAKRTARHLYGRQRRGGMGVFNLEPVEGQPATILAMADESQAVLLITNLGRVFRLQVTAIAEAAVNGRAASMLGRLEFAPQEMVAALLPIQAKGYLAAVSETGMVRLLRHHVFGEYMKPGTTLYDIKSFGRLAGVSWTPGDGDLFIATRQGRAIRFAEKLVPPQGCLGIRLSEDDRAVAITGVYDESLVFLLGADGKGTIRQIRSFNPNKSPGAGGKNAMSTSHLIGAASLSLNDDIFIISRLGKIIRFEAAQVPCKDGIVQGVNCMSFRADEAAAFLISPHALP